MPRPLILAALALLTLPLGANEISVRTLQSGSPASASTAIPPQLVNDLDLRVVSPDGSPLLGNERLHPGQPDRLNNVEVVSISNPAAGVHSVTVAVNRLGFNDRQSYALVITGDLAEETVPRRRVARR